MARLDNYAQYDGVNPYTGSIRNALEFAGVTAPHTGKPFTEAFLLGISGGITFGYFFFHYEGYAPQVNLLTRNTFNNYGWDTITRRLGIVQDLRQSVKEERAVEHLVETLEQGIAPIVWADVFTLGYEQSELGDEMWAMLPMVVSEFDVDRNRAVFADRSRVAIEVDTALFTRARARIKKDRYRFVTLDLPEPGDLQTAVLQGVKDCVSLYYEKPPRGSANNFGFKAYERWRGFLTKDSGKGSWAVDLPDGSSLFAALTTAFKYGLLHWKDDSLSADRYQFAAFLDEAATILKKPEIGKIAVTIRSIGDLWRQLGHALLPDDIPVLREARGLLVEGHSGFLGKGLLFGDRSREIERRMDELATEAEDALSTGPVTTELKREIAARVGHIAQAEYDSMERLKQLVA